VPLAPVVALVMVGFCAVEVNPFGPVQLQLVPAGPYRCRSLPAQTGESLVGLGAPGVVLMVTLVVPAGEVHPLVVTVNV
jgi:hypothetical protein